MYRQRLHILIILCICTTMVCIVRLAYLQIFQCEDYREQIRLKRILDPEQLPTVRGNIKDRHGNIIATDKPEFYLHISYQLTRLLDDRFWQLQMEIRSTEDEADVELKVREEYREELANLENIIDKCSQLSGESPDSIRISIWETNDRVWGLRRYFAWLRKYPDANTRPPYSLDEPIVTLKDISKINLGVMYDYYPLIKLSGDKELLQAQLDFFNIEGVEISLEPERFYPYRTSACQIIGWVGPAQEEERELFAEDDYLRYLEGEVTGKRGVEKVCEPILRGQRGEVTYDRDNELISKKPTVFGTDIKLTLDIELQKRIEEYLTDPNRNPNSDMSTAVVVIEVATGDILALVSTPLYDLNNVRADYNKILSDPKVPMKNRALTEHYPPGSSIKPFILIAGLEEGKVKPNEVISCPNEDQKAKYRFPNCLLFKLGTCHDWRWENEGGNIARNAIRGSCNVYFSRLSNRIEPLVLQRWLYEFGFGREILPGPNTEIDAALKMNIKMRQAQGQISSDITNTTIDSFDKVPKLAKYELRYFGIGQGSLRANVLQVANAAALIARSGIYKNPRLFLSEKDIYNAYQKDLGISKKTINIIRDGMGAVINETGGTAYEAFKNNIFTEKDIKVFGKTGSTEKPYNAWFMSFAEDSSGRAISLALMVQGGKSGGKDAAPLGREIIMLCNETGYIGKADRSKESILNPNPNM